MTLYQPRLVYTTAEHGTSIKTFYNCVDELEPTLMVLKTSKNEVLYYNWNLNKWIFLLTKVYKTTSSISPYVNFEKETLHLFSEFIAVANCLIFNELDVRDSGTRMFLFLNLQLDLFFFTPNQPSAEFFFIYRLLSISRIWLFLMWRKINFNFELNSEI